MHTYQFFHNSLMLDSRKKTSSTLQYKRSNRDFDDVFLPSGYHVFLLKKK